MEASLSSVLFIAFCFVRAFGADSPSVTTSQGRIVGTTLQFRPEGRPEFHRDVDAYLGIPYAEPPVGPLRLKPPVAKSWTGELQATRLGNSCPQSEINIGKLTSTGSSDEDCLVLHVYVPQQVPSEAAVLVFIHGGGYSIGQGTVEGFSPTPAAVIGDVILVTMNYRLGALGFLSTGDDVIPGNFGMLDQQLALKWVRDNIQAFGGDPERVAIFGESAGSASVNLQMLSPGSAGLFRGAIMESGDSFSPWATVEAGRARKIAFAFGKLVGCERDTSEELLECLQKVEDVEYIIKNQQEGLAQEFGTNSILLAPVVDGSFLPDKPAELYAKSAVNDAVSIIGSNADEGMMWFVMLYPNNTDEAPVINSTTYEAFYPMFVSAISTTAEPIVAEAVNLMYTDPTCTDGPGCNYLEALSQIGGDSMFVCPAEKTARAYTQAGRKVYRYLMTHNPTTHIFGQSWSKATHGEDLSFVFGLPLSLVPSDDFQTTEDEVRMSIQTIKYWSNLAKTGNPNLSSLDAELTDEEKKTEWPLFTVEGLEYKDLTPDMLNGRGIKARECRFWNEFMPELIKTAEDAKKCKDSSSKWTQDGSSSDSETCTKEKCPEVPEE